MGLYTRGQLLLLLGLLAAAAGGLGVSHWRAAHPDLAERLERIDREIAQTAEVEAEAPGPARRADAGARRPREREHAEASPARSRPSKREPPPAGEPTTPLDLNRATLGDLVRLPGVGPVLARRILETREEIGRFGTVDDLVAVRGLGRVRLDRLRPLVGVPE